MSAGPIEDQATKATSVESIPPKPETGEEYFGTKDSQSPNAARAAAGLPPFKPETTPEEDLIKAQHLFIEGLLNFLHDPSKVAQFAGEQEQYIRASMRYTGTKLGQK